MSTRLVATLSLIAALVIASDGRAQQNRPALHSASEYLSEDMRAEQYDDARNRAMLWVDLGEAIWNEPAGQSGKSCSSCHGAAALLKGVAARYPRIDAASGRLVNLEGRINQCRVDRQKATALAFETNELLGLTAMIARHSRGMPVDVDTGGPAQSYLEAGRRFWTTRQGQMNLSCAQCHDDKVGRKLRGDTISSGLGTGYPAYRLEWQGMGSLHRRLRACQIGVRAIPFEQGAAEYLALELYLAWRAKGTLLDAPALRR